MEKNIKKNIRFIKEFGPGLITGASDDDPSGILTYLQSGVIWGMKALWTAVLTLPLMYAVQEMCARIGYVTQKGLVSVLKENYSRTVLYFIALISLTVIVVNIGADLLAVGISLENISSVDKLFWIPVSAAFILFFMIFFSFNRFTSIMKWLCLSLFSYIIVVFFLKINWREAVRATFIPDLKWSKDIPLLLAAILGTTISPYLFFWQASEEKEAKENQLANHEDISGGLKLVKKDTFLGMLLSNGIMWFIILGASRLSSAYGVAKINDFSQASLVLKPLLGNFANLIFNIGIIGTGLLAIPVLAGSIGYILAELFNWSEGINKKFWQAKGFYYSIIGATLLGMATVLLKINVVQLLIFAAVFYAIITPILIYFIIKVANNAGIMGDCVNSKISNFFGWLSFAVVAASVLLYFFALI